MGGPSVSRTVTVGLPNGLHLGPCAVLVKLVTALNCDVQIRNGSKLADAKVIWDLMGMEALFGNQLEITASGDDAEAAMSQILQLFESNFGEESVGH